MQLYAFWRLAPIPFALPLPASPHHGEGRSAGDDQRDCNIPRDVFAHPSHFPPQWAEPTVTAVVSGGIAIALWHAKRWAKSL
jgi:hypothetical protein